MANLVANGPNPLSSVTSFLGADGASATPQTTNIIYVWGGIEVQSGDNTIGIQTSGSNTGVLAAGGQYGVYGIVLRNGTAAIYGTGGATALAGQFTGPVVIDGDRADLQLKAVRWPGDADPVVLRVSTNLERSLEFCGQVILRGNSADVEFPDEFKALADTNLDKCFVFLTPQMKLLPGLYVSWQDENGFTITVDGGNSDEIRIGYHVVAARKAITTQPMALRQEQEALPARAADGQSRRRGTKKRAKAGR